MSDTRDHFVDNAHHNKGIILHIKGNAINLIRIVKFLTMLLVFVKNVIKVGKELIIFANDFIIVLFLFTIIFKLT